MIEEFPLDTKAVEGEGVYFKVGVSGTPRPQISWFFLNQQLQSDYSREVDPSGMETITMVISNRIMISSCGALNIDDFTPSYSLPVKELTHYLNGVMCASSREAFSGAQNRILVNAPEPTVCLQKEDNYLTMD